MFMYFLYDVMVVFTVYYLLISLCLSIKIFTIGRPHFRNIFCGIVYALIYGILWPWFFFGR